MLRRRMWLVMPVVAVVVGFAVIIMMNGSQLF